MHPRFTCAANIRDGADLRTSDPVEQFPPRSITITIHTVRNNVHRLIRTGVRACVRMCACVCVCVSERYIEREHFFPCMHQKHRLRNWAVWLFLHIHGSVLPLEKNTKTHTSFPIYLHVVDNRLEQTPEGPAFLLHGLHICQIHHSPEFAVARTECALTNTRRRGREKKRKECA